MPFSRVIAKLEPYFATHQVTGKSPGRQPFTGYTPFDSTRKYAKHQAHVIMGNMAFSAYQQQRIPMALLNNILGGPAMNSRLNLTLREKNGIAYNLESNYQAFTDSGLFTIYCGTDDTLLPRAVELIHRELRSLRESGLSRIKLHTAQRQLRGQLAISMQSQQHEMLAMGKNVLVYNKVDTLAEIYCKIDAITASDILEVASQVFNPAGLSMLTFTSK
jgi:predicted Zn-dependent peptidase